jgi:phosphoglycerate dehydrogenase-like enzyme
LCTLDNVILTPHIAGVVHTTRADELSETLAEVRRVLDGATLRHPMA